MANILDWKMVACEFAILWRYYVYFCTNNIGKGMNPFILPAIGYQHRFSTKVALAFNKKRKFFGH